MKCNNTKSSGKTLGVAPLVLDIGTAVVIKTW